MSCGEMGSGDDISGEDELCPRGEICKLRGDTCKWPLPLSPRGDIWRSPPRERPVLSASDFLEEEDDDDLDESRELLEEPWLFFLGEWWSREDDLGSVEEVEEECVKNCCGDAEDLEDDLEVRSEAEGGGRGLAMWLGWKGAGGNTWSSSPNPNPSDPLAGGNLLCAKRVSKESESRVKTSSTAEGC